MRAARLVSGITSASPSSAARWAPALVEKFSSVQVSPDSQYSAGTRASSQRLRRQVHRKSHLCGVCWRWRGESGAASHQSSSWLDTDSKRDAHWWLTWRQSESPCGSTCLRASKSNAVLMSSSGMVWVMKSSRRNSPSGMFDIVRQLERPHAAKRRAAPHPASDQLERAGGDFFASAGHADNHRFAPAPVAAFQRRARITCDIADAFKRKSTRRRSFRQSHPESACRNH